MKRIIILIVTIINVLMLGTSVYLHLQVGVSPSTQDNYFLHSEDYRDIILADTARILDSIYNDRDHCYCSSRYEMNITSEIQVRLVIDSIETAKQNRLSIYYTDYNKFVNALNFYYNNTLEYYNKLDKEDPWNGYYAKYDLINKIKEHTEWLRK